jgi:Tfp pilus assembly protein PilX
MATKRSRQKGSALIFALILVLVLSVMGSSLMFLSQSETWSSMNYRMMTQARYGAESGLNVAANYIMNNYAAPTYPFAGYDTTQSPVLYGGNPVQLSTVSGQSNYPVGSVITAFQNAVNTPGSVSVGNNTVNYTVTATLLSMGNVGTASGYQTVQMWRITADGTINGVVGATEEVSAVMERQVTSSNSYAAFATATGCSALSFSGGGQTNSYDSATLTTTGGVAAPPSTFGSVGNVGSNGNLTEDGAPTIINGTMSTPDTGVGNCSSGNVTAWTDNGNAQVTGGLIKLPQIVNFPTPVIPAPGSGTQNYNNSADLLPGNYGDISLTGHGVVTLHPGFYNINSISDTGANTEILLDLPAGCGSGPACTVTINVTGNGQSTPINITGNSFENPTLIPSDLQINYAGTGAIKIAGNAEMAAVVYAPNASITMKGGADFYGSVIGSLVDDAGGITIHYDTELSKKNNSISNYMLDSFNWAKY